GKSSELMLSGAYLSDNKSSLDSRTTAASVTSTITNNEKTTQMSAMAKFSYTAITNQEFAATTGLILGNYKADLATAAGAVVGSASSQETKTTTIPLGLGYEIQKLGESQKWALRGAIAKALYVSKKDTTATTLPVVAAASSTTEDSIAGNISWGIGVGYGASKNLTIDANMNQGTLFAGTNLLSTGAGTLITRLTVTYAM
ncbi:MAG: hypothetical protein AABY83_00180, partial [Pseudomonadota bacterium]